MFRVTFKSVKVEHLSPYVISLGVSGYYTQAIHPVSECQSRNTQVILLLEC